MTAEDSVASSVNKLVLSEEAFFFERSLDLLSVIGLDGYFKRINPVFTQILGYSPAELLARPFIEFVHPEDHCATLAEMEKLKAGAPTLYFENRYRTQNGSYRWLEWTASPQVEKGVIYCVAREITGQKEMEVALQRANQELEQRVAERTAQLEQVNAALRESEERHQLAMEVARMFTFEWEPHTDVVKRSPQCAVILGLSSSSAEDDTSANYFQRVHPDDRDRFVAGLQALTPENSTYKTSYRVVRPDGQILTLEESGRALFNQSGQLTRLIGITADVTERQLLETQLEASRATLHRQLAEIETIYQSAPIGLNVLDSDLRFVRINQLLAEINGFSVEEHIGRTVRELLPDIADTAEELLRPIFGTGQGLLNVEIRGETPAQPGVERIWLESFLPLKDDDRVIGINTVCQEITERKRTESALRQSEEFKQRILDSSSDCIKVLDLEGRLLYINPQGLCLIEVDDFESIRHATWSSFWSGETRTSAEAALLAAKAGGTGKLQGYCPTATGKPKWWDVVVTPIKDADGQVIQILSISRDITKRRQAEEALRESEDRLRMAIASAQLGTWDWNLVTGELKWDIACKAMFGLPPEAKISIEVFFAALHPDDRDRLQETIQLALNRASGGAFDADYRTIGIEDRVERWLRAKGQVYYDAQGKPLRFSGTVLNITEQKQAEAQREKLFQQEQAAREAAEHANRTKDQFLAILSHELRTPLNPILGWAGILQSPNVSAEKLQLGLATIERNAKQQVQLIEDLLDISRIIRGQLSLSLTAINLSEPIVAALATVNLAAQAKEIQIEVLLDPLVGQVRGDAGRLQQVVWNLLSNAIKFNSPGGRVKVQLSSVERYAQIQISDNGKGIKPEFLPHVFESFQQQDSSTTRFYGGLGLGLAIARQIVEAHGGTITATSPGEGQGATFTVKLPLIPTVSANTPDAFHPPTVNLENRRVMVVDDEADSLELVKVILEEEGADVLSVSSATTALRLLTQSKFDLLISDIGMPEMDGYAFIRQLRALPPQFNRDIPAIALTAYAGDTNRRKILVAGFQSHLEKPIEPQHLLDAIASVIIS